LAEVVVEPDAGGEREQFGGDPGAQAMQAARAVSFQAQAVFERRLDPRAVSTERPHSTGVESSSTTSSKQPGESWANIAHSHSIVSASRSRLPVAGLLGQLGKQVTEPPGGDRQELAIGRDVHHRLCDSERDDLRIGHASPDVLPARRQEIVSRGEHGREQQVEVGEHRGPLGRQCGIGTADFDRC
jgi:hypothetical protein